MADKLSRVLPAVFCLAAAGCGGGDLGTVEGRVTLDGQPLAGAVVRFLPKDGSRPSEAVTDEQGHYELRFTEERYGALVGEHRVQVSTYGEDEDEQGKPVIVPEKVPMKYNIHSELFKKVEPGSNEIDLPLDSKGPIYDPAKEPQEDPDDDC